jgi:hypothetical protein
MGEGYELYKLLPLLNMNGTYCFQVEVRVRRKAKLMSYFLAIVHCTKKESTEHVIFFGKRCSAPFCFFESDV